jgi:hypothetical protein
LPQFKKLVKEYDHEMATVYFLKRKDITSKSFWDLIWDSFSKLWQKR